MSTVGVSANRLEILQIAKAVAEEKSIDRGIVIGAMQEAIEKAAKSRYGQEHDIRAEIDRKSGEIKLARYLEVAEGIENGDFWLYSLPFEVLRGLTTEGEATAQRQAKGTPA